MKGDMDMKEKNRAEEWFRAKHDELAETAQGACQVICVWGVFYK